MGKKSTPKAFILGMGKAKMKCIFKNLCNNKFEILRKYVKELQNFPLEFLFEPWKAPLEIQEEAGCILGRDYPEPIIDHVSAFRQNILKLRQFFHTEKKEVFQTFLEDTNVLKPSNSEEYKSFTFDELLKSETGFDDF